MRGQSYTPLFAVMSYEIEVVAAMDYANAGTVVLYGYGAVSIVRAMNRSFINNFCMSVVTTGLVLFNVLTT